MAITQTISTVPAAGHRGIDIIDDFVTSQEAYQDHQKDVLEPELNELITQMNAESTTVNENSVIAKESADSATASEAVVVTAEAVVVDAEAVVIGKEALTVINADQTQLDKWITEASKNTANSSASEPEDVEVKVYTSNGDGTFTSTAQTGKFSALHERLKANQIVNVNIDSNGDVDTSGKAINDYLQWSGTSWVAFSPPPELLVALSSAGTGRETTTVVVTDDNYDADRIYSATVNFGSVVNNNDGTFTATLPDYATATSITVTVNGDKAGFLDTTTTHIITVTNTQVATPSFTGSVTDGTEQTVVVITDVNDETDATYFPSVTSGSVVDNLDGTYSVTLPIQANFATCTLSVYGTRTNDIDSPTTNWVITVNAVGYIQDDAIVDTLATDVINDGF